MECINRGLEELRGEHRSGVEMQKCYVLGHSCIFSLKLGANIDSAAECIGIRNKEEEREGYADECAYRTVYFHPFYK
jgi:hypothetical protein